MRMVTPETTVCATELWPVVLALAVTVGLFALACPAAQKASTTRDSGQPDDKDIVITIVYDNNPGQKELTTAWGFACVIQGMEKTILFDTGGDGEILLGNMRHLNLEAKEIDAIVLSHIHGDHTDGLPSFLQVRTGVPVYIPAGFPSAFKERVQSLGGQIQEAAESKVVCRGVHTTSTLGKGAIEEHGVCVKTPKGWVLITGCAHPGVANMATQAKAITGEPIHLAVGGFHMVREPESKINAVIDRLEELGVQQVVPCHCTGEAARRLFKQRFGDRCDLNGVGNVLRFPADKGADKP